LKGSPVVNGDDLELYVNIIMRGYDPKPEYASMPAVGLNNGLSSEEITAIINYERSSWGNHAKPVSPEEVKKIVDFILLTTKQ
jgi:cytochrome c oxidase cbb3-type subunit 2